MATLTKKKSKTHIDAKRHHSNFWFYDFKSTQYSHLPEVSERKTPPKKKTTFKKKKKKKKKKTLLLAYQNNCSFFCFCFMFLVRCLVCLFLME